MSPTLAGILLYTRKNKRHRAYTCNSLSECRLFGADKEKERMGYTYAYYPFALWIEVPQIAAFHKKLIFVGVGVLLKKLILNIGGNLLIRCELHSVRRSTRCQR